MAIPNVKKPKGCYYCPLEQLSECRLLDNKFVEEIDIPNDCPIIEIVECKDCKHYQREECRLDPFWEKQTEPTDFCSKGEMRADENIENQ